MTTATKLNPNFTTYTGTDHEWEYTYTSRRLDNETGLMYYRARYYHTALGRFINRDPIGYADGMNLYAYVGGNPLAFVDPSGLLLVIAGNPDYTAAIVALLKKMCSLISEKGGFVTMGKGKPLEDDMCCCLKELIGNGFTNIIHMPLDPRKPVVSVPNVLADAIPQKNGKPDKGTGGRAEFNPDYRGLERDKLGDLWQEVPNEIVLFHELCGHVLRFNKGIQKEYKKVPRGKPKPEEQDAIKEENEFRKKKGYPSRKSSSDSNTEKMIPGRSDPNDWAKPHPNLPPNTIPLPRTLK